MYVPVKYPHTLYRQVVTLFHRLFVSPSEKHSECPSADPHAPEPLPGEVQAPGREQQPRPHPRQMPHEAAVPPTTTIGRGGNATG